MHTLAGSVLGCKHRAVTQCGAFLKHYDRMEGRLANAMDKQFGTKASPSVMVFHVHLMWFNWLQEQTALATTCGVDTPDFSQGLKACQMTMTLNWVPNISEVDELAPLMGTSNRSGTRGAAPVTGATASNTNNRQNRTVHNPARDPRHVGRGPLAASIRGRSVRDAIRIGGEPPEVQRNGVAVHQCVSWHCKGQCVNDCERVADHTALQPAESDALHEWCQQAFA